MTLRSTILLASSLLVLALGSCRRDSDPVLVAELDSLITHLDSLDQAFRAIDEDEHRAMDSVFKRQVPALQQAFVDTLDRDTALLLGNYYRTMTKSLGRLVKEHAQVRSGLDSSLKKVRDLRRDVDRGLIPMPERRAYTDQEEKIASDLDRQVTVLLNSRENVMRHWAKRDSVDAILADRSGSKP